MDSEHRFTLGPHSVAVFLKPGEPIVVQPESDGHCLVLDNLSVNQTLYITLDLVNTCDDGLNYPGVNATSDHPDVTGFFDGLEWYYGIPGNATYPYQWQLSVCLLYTSPSPRDS